MYYNIEAEAVSAKIKILLSSNDDITSIILYKKFHIGSTYSYGAGTVLNDSSTKAELHSK